MAKKNKITQPVLPLRDIVVFPNMIVRLFVGRDKSVRALEEVMKDNKEILLASQIDATQDEPTEESINKVGVTANVLQILKLPDGAVKILVEGKNRVKIEEILLLNILEPSKHPKATNLGSYLRVLERHDIYIHLQISCILPLKNMLPV